MGRVYWQNAHYVTSSSIVKQIPFNTIHVIWKGSITDRRHADGREPTLVLTGTHTLICMLETGKKTERAVHNVSVFCPKMMLSLSAKVSLW